MGASWIFDIITEDNDSLRPLLAGIDTGYADMMCDQTTYTLVELLHAFRSFEATDPRDKVYGLLNLISSRSEREAIEVNYDKSVGQVYADTALVIIALYSDLSVLA
jgi:hypothetical protein